MKHIDNEATVKMVQTSKSRWKLTTRSGYVLVDNLHIVSVREAEEYVKSYISCYHCWKYEIEPLAKGQK